MGKGCYKEDFITNLSSFTKLNSHYAIGRSTMEPVYDVLSKSLPNDKDPDWWWKLTVNDQVNFSNHWKIYT